jgi:hypothetical protein
MLKKAFRLILVIAALLFAVAAPVTSTAYADCASASGTVCPH